MPRLARLTGGPRRPTLAILASLGLVAAVGLSLYAADKPADAPKAAPKEAAAGKEEGKAPAYLDPEKAGPDYKVQGEYAGETDGADKHKVAAQVVALGKGEFLAVFFAGGLPADGWDGKTRIEVPGKAHDPAGGEVGFGAADGKGYSATSGADQLRVKTDGGETAVLKKVERKSPTEGAKPPEGATVLFDGSNTDAWQGGKTDDRHLLACGTKTKKTYQNFTLHVEFLLPFKPLGRDQDRGNSGIYIQDRYEVQVLDTFGHKPEFNGIGSVYRQHEPSVNASFPPLRWQTYDIDFQAPKFDADGKKTHNGVITVKLNGVVVQDKYDIKDKTGAGQKEGPTPGPIQLQQHNNPVFYRNIWIVEK